MQVRIASLDNLKEAGKEVKGEKEDPPTLVLSDVNMFVEAMMGKCFMVHADDDVSNRHGTEATIARKRRKTSVNAPARNLNCALDNSALCAERKSDKR